MPLDDSKRKEFYYMNSINRKNRIKQWLRIRLGILHMIHNPLLNILLIPIVFLAIVLWKEKGKILALYNVPNILLPVWEYSVTFLIIILPILACFLLVSTIGTLTASKDEGNLAEAFDNYDLRNGYPILMSKKRIKGTDVIRREFYSSIPMTVWVDKQEYIADCMNVHFVEPLQYGGKSNGRRIVMYTAKGRKPVSRGDLYDDEL